MGCSEGHSVGDAVSADLHPLTEDREIREMNVPAIDIYVTYRCNMRCRHCFVGDLLNTSQDMPRLLLEGIINEAKDKWATEELVYLGGEPSLYPYLGEAIRASHDSGYRVRLVSNGSTSLRRLLAADEYRRPLEISVSLDGANVQQHDSIRRAGAFRGALDSVTEALARGHIVNAIISVGTHNISHALDTLQFLAEIGVESVSIHYVSNRGFADPSMPVDVEAWLEFRRQVIGLASPLRVRFERTFHDRGSPLRCAVQDRSMLMFFPDGRVFQCPMYLEGPNGHSFRWNGRQLEDNPHFSTLYGAALTERSHCPAMKRINAELCQRAERINRKVGCVFDKEEIVGNELNGTHSLKGVVADVSAEAS